jgi:dTDP-4-amino-4,6-dideoxygalactose transaminase
MPAVENSRIYLSAPCVGPDERKALLESFDSGWIAPLGPHVDAFEAEFARYHGVGDAAALSSGTAALHLALHMLGVGAGDDVLVSTMTFVATANAISYVGATPVFVDSENSSWNLDPSLVAEHLQRSARAGKLPKAVIAVDVLGQCADYDPLRRACEEFGVSSLSMAIRS